MIHRFALLLLVLLLFNLGETNAAINSHLEMIEKNHAPSHPEKFKIMYFTDYWLDVLTAGKEYSNLHQSILLGAGMEDLSTIYIPPVLIPGMFMPECKGDISCQEREILLAIANDVIATLGSAVEFVGFVAVSIVSLGTYAAYLMKLIDNTYVIAPHEVYNFSQGFTYKYSESKSSFDWYHEDSSKKPVSSQEIPFYYSCDESKCSCDKSLCRPEDDLDGCLGYKADNDTFCPYHDPEKRYGDNAILVDRIGAIEVRYLPNRGVSILTPNAPQNYKTSCDRLNLNCDDGKEVYGDSLYIKPGSLKQYYGQFITAYYRFNVKNNVVEVCAAYPYTWPPLLIGCTSTSPPYEQMKDYFQDDYNDTRCSYFNTGRSDLKALGKYIAQTGKLNHHIPPIAEFLRSDLHITSTVVGCTKDLLIKVFLLPNDGGDKGMLAYIQQQFHSIVQVALVLSISLFGIKMIASAQPVNKGEIIMYIIKLALVLYFTTPAAWYSVDEDGTVSGIYPTIIDASDIIAGFFVQAENSMDVMGFCSYKSNMTGGRELLQNHNISTSLINTEYATSTPLGGDVIRLSVWDLLDCKLLNYLNMGSCKYSTLGIISLWLMSAAFFSGITGVFLSIITLIYLFMIMKILLQYAHITIISAFILTILISLSPIVILFSLFSVTKGIFDTWLKMIIGYMLYPALLLVFLSFMFAAFDTIYYGDVPLDQELAQNNQGWAIDNTGNEDDALLVACKENDSIFCATVKSHGGNPCDTATGMLNKYVKVVSFVIFQAFVLDPEIITSYFNGMLKLLLFSILFYFFTDAINEFLSYMVGVNAVSSPADLSSYVAKGAGKAAGASLGLAGKGVKKLFGSGGDGDGGGESGGSRGDSDSGDSGGSGSGGSGSSGDDKP